MSEKMSQKLHEAGVAILQNLGLTDIRLQQSAPDKTKFKYFAWNRPKTHTNGQHSQAEVGTVDIKYDKTTVCKVS